MEEMLTKEIQYEYSIPVVALRGLVVMPNIMLHFDLNRKKSIAAIEYAMNHDKKVFLVSQLVPETEEPTIDDIYKIGCFATVKQINKRKDGVVGAFVSGISRGKIESFLEENEAYLSADVELLTTVNDIETITKTEAMLDYIRDLFLKYIQFFPKIGQGFGDPFARQSSAEPVVDMIAAGIPIDYKKKQQILETLVLSERIENLAVILSNEINVANVKMDLANKIKGRIEQHQKE